MEKRKIIIDTDIGDDIDDAFALALALSMPVFEIMGVTTAYRNAGMRAKIAVSVLSAYGFGGIKTYAGESLPIKEPVRFFPFETAGGPVRIPHYSDKMAHCSYDGMDAADFILESAAAHPGKITLYALAPQTNLAKAYLKNPVIFRNLKEIVMMAGCLGQEYAEWNVKCDPEAAHIVLNAGVPIRMTGLNVTRKCIIGESSAARISAMESSGNKLLSSMMEVWIKHNRKMPILHDPLAVASSVMPFCTYKERTVEVGLDGANRGVLRESGTGVKIMFAEEADALSFEKFMLEALLKFEKEIEEVSS